jgi:hypothetical protein
MVTQPRQVFLLGGVGAFGAPPHIRHPQLPPLFPPNQGVCAL